MKTSTIHLFSVFFLTFFLICKTDPTENLNIVVNFFQCEDKCIFNYTEISSITLKFFPKCELVCAIIVINSKTDVSAVQLKKAFKNMRTLLGGLWIENSNLTDLSIFTTDKESGSFNIACDFSGIFILNNSQLSDPNNMFNLINPYRASGNRECVFEVQNNAMLEVDCDYGYIPSLKEIYVVGNLKNCRCHGGKLSEAEIKTYTGCQSLSAGLEISNLTDPSVLSYFSNLTYIRGDLNIHHSNIQNLSFLENLEILKISNNGSGEKIDFNLHDNPEMTRLGFPKLEEFKNAHDTYDLGGLKLRIANFENLHPDFCLTLPEIHRLMWSYFHFKNLHAKLCADPGEIPDTVNCIFKSMSDLPNDCGAIIGDITIGEADEVYVSKLDWTSYLVGTVTIRNTQLNDTYFLSYLSYIVSFSDSPVIQIYSNPNLKRVSVGGTGVVTRGKRIAIVQDNHANLFKSKPCDLFNEHNQDSDLVLFRTNLTYTGSHCGEKVEIGNLGASKLNLLIFVILWSLNFLKLHF